MASKTLSLSKLVSSDFSEGSSWVLNKGGGGDTDVGYFVFNSLGVSSVKITNVSFKINAIETGGNNLLSENIYLNFEFGAYSSSTFTKSNAFSFSQQEVKESQNQISVTATSSGNATMSGDNLCIKLILTPKSNSIGSKIIMSGFTLTVTYEVITHTVTWKNHDGTVLETDTGVASGTTPTYNGSTPTKTGYTFSGWSPNIGAISGDTTYTAQFTANSYTIKFNANGGSGSISNLNMTYDVPKNLTAIGNNITRAGYTFLGWSTSSTATAATYADKASVKNLTTSGTVTLYAVWKVKSFTVTIKVDGYENHNVDIGTVSMNGSTTGASYSKSYEYGTSITLIATPFNAGCRFIKWSDGNTNSTRTETVTNNITYSAIFERIIFTQTVVASPSDGGIVTGSGEYYYEDTYIITAVANPGYRFLNWSRREFYNGVENVFVESYSSSSSLTLTQYLTENIYTANFEKIKYTITTNSSPSKGGTVSGGGSHYYGSNVITATPNVGYKFIKWSDGVIDNPRTINVTNNASYTAIFELINYTIELNVVPTGGGTISISDPPYNYGTVVGMQAYPATGYVFVGWSDGKTNEYDISARYETITEDCSFTAIFEEITYKVNIDFDQSQVEITGVKDKYRYGEKVTLIVTPNYGYDFTGWRGDVNSDSQTISFEIYYDMTLQCLSYPSRFNVSFINDPNSSHYTQLYLTEVEPPENPVKQNTAQWKYTFDGWYDENGIKLTDGYLVTKDLVFTARFTAEVQTYTIRWFNYDGSLLETDYNVPYNTKPSYNGVIPTKEGNAEHSYQFLDWSLETDKGITPVLGTEYIDIYAVFTEVDNTYTVVWRHFDGEKFVILETDTYVPYGDRPDYNEESSGIPTRLSDAQYDYDFIGWSLEVKEPVTDGTDYPDDDELPIVTGDVIYTAVYSATTKMYPITVILADGEYTSICEYGSTITITAVDNDKQEFIMWSDGSTDRSRDITITGEAVYRAIYGLNCIYVGKSRAKSIYVGNKKVKGIFIGTTKIYG